MPHHLHLSQDQLLAILSSSANATAIYANTDLRIYFVSNGMLAFWGKGREIIGRPLEEGVPELRGQPFADMLRAVLSTGVANRGSAIPAETRINGHLQTRYYAYAYEPVKDENGNTYAVLHTAADVTDKVIGAEAIRQADDRLEALERERALNEELATTNEELNQTNDELIHTQETLLLLNDELERRVVTRTSELLESESRFKAMAEGSGILIAVSDEHRNAIYFNKAWLNFTGKSMPDLLGFGWSDLIHAEDHDRYLRIYTSAFNKRENFTTEFRFKDRGGAYRWLMVNGVPRLLPDGTFIGYVSSCTDITELKEVEQRKDDFISIASHELKTPLTSLKASLQLMERLQEQVSPPLVVRLIDQCSRSMLKITTLIENLLNTSRTQESQLHLHKRAFSINEMLHNCCNHIRLGGDHELIVEGDTELMILGDEERIDQVIVNLVNNAVKYAPKSREIFLETEKYGDMAKISIRDTGPGIALQKQPHLFERYYRADESGQYSGLGLGLYISAEIVRKHGGEIGVDSEPGNGCTFWFTLPLA